MWHIVSDYCVVVAYSCNPNCKIVFLFILLYLKCSIDFDTIKIIHTSLSSYCVKGNRCEWKMDCTSQVILFWSGWEQTEVSVTHRRTALGERFSFLLCFCYGAYRRKENKLMESLLNVIRAIIDMLPGRCKTINSSFSLWYLPSTPLFCPTVFHCQPDSHTEEGPLGDLGGPKESVSVMLTRNLWYRWLNWQQCVAQ